MVGLLITLEGVEGSGKSTQIQRLAARLSEAQVPLVLSKEPGGTALGRELRSLLLAPHDSGDHWCPTAELLLFYADRAQHLETLVRPALAAGKLVLIDRFEDSTRAYQGASGVAEADLERLRAVVLRGLRPDLTLVLDMDPELSLARVSARNAATAGFRETRFDDAALAFHQRVRTGFQAVAAAEPERVKLIAADRDPEAVAEALWVQLRPLLVAHGHSVS